ncbi:MAG TPA: hypothetical protein VK166_07420, partial [Chitinophagaceae bacterium]|nr:hypothetical protein [Chitinophagaceae bacterium]
MAAGIRLALAFSLMSISAFAQQKWEEKQLGELVRVVQKGGQTLGYSTSSGVKLITKDGFAFKDLN